MKTSLKILIHTIFWLVFSSFSITFLYSKYTVVPNFDRIPHVLINELWAASIFYLFYIYFIRFFERGQFVKYLFYSILMSIGITVVYTPLHRLFLPELSLFDYTIFGPHIIGTFILGQCGSLVGGFENWMEQIKQKADLQNKNLKNELELLKSQINPHFLFNTLNNIDVLIHKSPDDASKTLLTLSDMLRYMIYDSNVEKVGLSREVNYLKQYLDLQKIRIRDTQFIEFNLDNHCHDARIAPLLLLPFVENAFKYAKSNKDQSAIQLSIQCENQQLNFECINAYNYDKPSEIHSGGVGLENVKKRLSLIYPNKHLLTIAKDNGIFHVQLNVDLS